MAETMRSYVKTQVPVHKTRQETEAILTKVGAEAFRWSSSPERARVWRLPARRPALVRLGLPGRSPALAVLMGRWDCIEWAVYLWTLAVRLGYGLGVGELARWVDYCGRYVS